jgi:hypothetical protein
MISDEVADWMLKELDRLSKENERLRKLLTAADAEMIQRPPPEDAP